MQPDTSPDPASFRMASADADQDLMAIAQTLSNEFAGGQYVDEISQKYIGSCHYDWATTRLIWDGERLVHHWGVWGYPMRLGSARLKVAGIGAVVTEETYRKRGLMSMAVTDSLKAMRDNGYDLSILRGRHYVKFGYVRAWNYVTYRLKPEEIPDYNITHPYEALGPDRMDEIVALYNQGHEAFSGTAVRPTYRMLQPGEMGAYGWFDADGKLAGYVRAVPTEDKKTLQCLEAAGDPTQGLAVLAELFKQEAYETLTFFTLPRQHPILQIIRRGACIVENRYFDISGWRVRIVNLQSTLEKIRPLLEARLKRSHWSTWQGMLLLDAGEQQAGLEIAESRVQITAADQSEHSIHGGPAVARFLIGADEPEEIIQQAEMVCTGQAAELAAVLFPNLYPMMSHWDEY
jgi:predicted N-acetyltransferase YhbS